MDVVTTKRCSRCGETKPVEEFNRASRRDHLDGLQNYCRSCHRESMREHYASTSRWSLREKKYGVSREDVNLQLELQEFTCAICPKEIDENTANIDHDHVTGEFRGLLCRECNLLLGYAVDDVERLLSAVVYLKGGTPRG